MFDIVITEKKRKTTVSVNLMFVSISKYVNDNFTETEISFWQNLITASMMTSSNGNIFHVIGPLCGEFTGHRWMPPTKASDAELWCFLWSAPWINGSVNNREAGDLKRHRAHYDVIVMTEARLPGASGADGITIMTKHSTQKNICIYLGTSTIDKGYILYSFLWITQILLSFFLNCSQLTAHSSPVRESEIWVVCRVV